MTPYDPRLYTSCVYRLSLLGRFFAYILSFCVTSIHMILHVLGSLRLALGLGV